MSRLYSQFEVGEEHVSARRYLTESDVAQYVYLSGDDTPLLVNGPPRDGRLLVPDLLTLIVEFGLGSRAIQPPMATLALLGISWEMHDSARVGDCIHVRSVLSAKDVSSKGHGKLTWTREVRADDRLLQVGEVVNLVRNDAR